MLTVNFLSGLLVFNDLVHQGLREHGLIELVVTHLSVANEVDDNIFAESLSVLSSNFEGLGDVFHAVGIDVENGGINGLCNIGSVDTRSGAIRSGRKSNLVVDDDMESSTDGVVLEILHLEALENDTLTSHSGVTVDDNRDNLLTVFLRSTQEVLLSAGSSSHDRVHSFEMRRVSQQRQFDFDTIFVSSLESGSKMVLDVTRSDIVFIFMLGHDTLELSHDNFSRLAHHVGENIQSASVGHADDVIATTKLGQSVNSNLQAGHK